MSDRWLDQRVAGREKRLNCIAFERPGVQEALPEIAVFAPQAFELPAFLDPFSVGLQPKSPSELHQSVDERSRLVRITHSRDERAVDLQYVNGELLQIGQRRIACAEVVDGNLDADVFQQFKA